MNPRPGTGAGGLGGGHRVFLFGLDGDDRVAGTHGLGAQQNAAHDLGGAVLEHGGVLVQQRFAFRSVGNHRVGLGGQFHMGGKSAAAGADNAGIAHLGDE